MVCGALCLLAQAAPGHSQKLDTTYGRRSGYAAASVNGTGVLARMFQQAGHRVSSWQSLSPRLKERADCIVWFPDDFRPPSMEVRWWLEEWLKQRPGRTLIYVGRDFDAAPWYWEKMQAKPPAERPEGVEGRLAAAKMEFKRARARTPAEENCGWFTVYSDWEPRKVRSLSGDWAEGVDAANVEIELFGWLEPAVDAEPLLDSEEETLVSRQTIGPVNNSLIVVANGSFLLNAMLVNHEHRKLAARLIEAVGPPGQSVVFLESESPTPPIRKADPQPRSPTGLEAASTYPIDWILLHFAAVGVILCFWRWPIFGRPSPPEPPGASDFGKHIDAVAGLLHRSRDRTYAMSRLRDYHKRVKGE